MDAIIDHLSRDPMAFTGEDTLDQDEISSTCNFALLATSVDATPFDITRCEESETPIAKVLSDQVIAQAVKTVISAACESNSEADPSRFEEVVEISVSTELLGILQTIVDYAKDR